MLTKYFFHKFQILRDDNVVFVSHNDLDGAGPIIIGDTYFQNYRYYTLANNSIDKVVLKLLDPNNYHSFDYLFITDCSVSSEVAEIIDNFNSTSSKKVFLFDHHATALYLNKYSWARVEEEASKISGTKLFYQYMAPLLLPVYGISWMKQLKNLVETINDWDTWLWVEKNNVEAKELSTLFSKTGIEYFIAKYQKSMSVITDIDKKLLESFDRKYTFVVKPNILKSARVMDLQAVGPNSERVSRPVLCVQTSETPGDLAEKLYTSDVNTVLIFFQDAVSIRTRDEEIHAGFWARDLAGVYGSGGGHSKAGGFKINKSNLWLVEKYLKLRFNE